METAYHRRPLSITILAWIYIAVGTIGAAAHFGGFPGPHYDVLEAELTEMGAVFSGAFLLLGRNWARWVALGWIGFHVVLSAFDKRLSEFAVHCVFCAAIAWLLRRPASARYFKQRLA
jgi:hypothetical protein